MRAKKKRANPRRPAKKRTAVKKRAAAKQAPTVKRKSAPRRPPIDRAALAAAEAEVRRLRAAGRRLERQLTEAVQEIGMLRAFELRAQMLESELSKRDAELARLRAETSDRLGGASIVATPAETEI